MKVAFSGLTVLTALLVGHAPAWAGWETYTDYRTEDVYAWVNVPTTYTVTVPDYGWVDQGAAVPRVAQEGGPVVLKRVSVSSLSGQAGSTSNAAGRKVCIAAT